MRNERDSIQIKGNATESQSRTKVPPLLSFSSINNSEASIYQAEREQKTRLDEHGAKTSTSHPLSGMLLFKDLVGDLNEDYGNIITAKTLT